MFQATVLDLDICNRLKINSNDAWKFCSKLRWLNCNYEFFIFHVETSMMDNYLIIIARGHVNFSYFFIIWDRHTEANIILFRSTNEYNTLKLLQSCYIIEGNI